MGGLLLLSCCGCAERVQLLFYHIGSLRPSAATFLHLPPCLGIQDSILFLLTMVAFLHIAYFNSTGVDQMAVETQSQASDSFEAPSTFPLEKKTRA